MRRLAAILVPLAALGGTASAQTSNDLGSYGAWTAYRATTASGRAICGIRVTGSEGRSLHLKYFAGDNSITVQAFRQGWTIPPGTRLRVELRVDQNAPWSTSGANGQRNMVEWTVAGGLDRFSSQFRNGSRLYLDFPQGSETGWVVSLTGSSAALGRMAECMQALRAGGGGPGGNSGGKGGGAPSQPFGNAPPAPQPSQPFGNPAPSAPPAPAVPRKAPSDTQAPAPAPPADPAIRRAI